MCPKKTVDTQARWHDVYPKPDLDGNFLGDGYPLCSDLPPAYFLSQGVEHIGSDEKKRKVIPRECLHSNSHVQSLSLFRAFLAKE